MKVCKFLPGKKYRYGGLEKFGFKAVVLCTNRVNHRNGTTTVKFIILDLKINEFNAGAREFIDWLQHEKPITIDNSDFEHIDTWYFTLDAENVIVS